jgi:hypothetical protein
MLVINLLFRLKKYPNHKLLKINFEYQNIYNLISIPNYIFIINPYFNTKITLLKDVRKNILKYFFKIIKKKNFECGIIKTE